MTPVKMGHFLAIVPPLATALVCAPACDAPCEPDIDAAAATIPDETTSWAGTARWQAPEGVTLSVPDSDTAATATLTLDAAAIEAVPSSDACDFLYEVPAHLEIATADGAFVDVIDAPLMVTEVGLGPSVRSVAVDVVHGTLAVHSPSLAEPSRFELDHVVAFWDDSMNISLRLPREAGVEYRAFGLFLFEPE